MLHEHTIDTRLATIAVGSVRLEGIYGIPANADTMVVFAHGSGSSRHSPRNNYVAHALQDAGMATLLFDLLTEREAADRVNVFDVEFLAERLRAVAQWVRSQARTRHLRLGYFGASTGAAAALIAAAGDPAVGAIVSRGGRPDLAGAALSRVRAPTLLIVGGNDLPVLRLNEEAYVRLRCEKELCVVPGAGHVFEEPGTLEDVVRLATAWYGRHLTARQEARRA